MFVFSNFLGAAAQLLDTLLSLYMWAIIIQAVISWVNPDPYNPIVRFLYQITEPVLRLIRRSLPIRGIGMDFSPWIAIIAIMFLRSFLVRTLLQFAVRLG